MLRDLFSPRLPAVPPQSTINPCRQAARVVKAWRIALSVVIDGLPAALASGEVNPVL
ncbi:MAG: hypothetical protein JAZ17_17040 [Candidatus Thiodiazotropha endolucinida]|nr:hypothetical protein [Candidatus Thiodiazotropha taylori]MCG8095297.1 hypothetical protein [Candidatus Thiodiazotropha endolucinida]MCW4342790.1 hypothetical protein [Candidatus Thiodiazotropha endolucinida]